MVLGGGNRVYPTDYEPPRDNVLLLTCMDLRLLDNIVQFMNHDNLVNRYDHVVFAGSALGALGAPGAKTSEGQPIDVSHWQAAFFEHLHAAITLHSIRDLYILEHRNCGAYSKYFNLVKDFGDSEKEQIKEASCHWRYARKLERKVHQWCADQKMPKLQVRKFLMDLRGNVTHLVKSGKHGK